MAAFGASWACNLAVLAAAIDAGNPYVFIGVPAAVAIAGVTAFGYAYRQKKRPPK